MIRPHRKQALRAIAWMIVIPGLVALDPLTALAGGQDSPPGSPDPRPWEIAHRWLAGERDRLAGDLERAHQLLTERAKREDLALLERLSPKPPRSRPSGYGILPRLLSDRPLAEPSIGRQVYSLEKLTTGFASDLRDAALLALKAKDLPKAPLEKMVESFERLRKRLKNLEDHLDYHDFWQQAAVDYSEFYARQNQTLDLVEQWHALETSAGDEVQRTSLRQEIAQRLTPFRPTRGLVIEERRDGTRVLPVRVHTDIDDESFLAAFRDAVEDAFGRSAAARERRFRLELEFELVSPESLYPEGAPEMGSRVVEREHRARFPKAAFVLTTGAKSTHVGRGRSIHLGPTPIRPRTLAHEFAHLLGFPDGYLRAHRGTPKDPWGVVFVEWAGLADGLMASPGSGRVTEAMIDQLLEAYAVSAPQRRVP